MQSTNYVLLDPISKSHFSKEVTLADGSLKLAPFVGPNESSCKSCIGFTSKFNTENIPSLGVILMKDIDLVVVPRTPQLIVVPLNPNIVLVMAA